MVERYGNALKTYSHKSLWLAVSISHLFDFGDISNEGIIVHKVQKPLQLVQVTDVVLTNPLRMCS